MRFDKIVLPGMLLALCLNASAQSVPATSRSVLDPGQTAFSN